VADAPHQFGPFGVRQPLNRDPGEDFFPLASLGRCVYRKLPGDGKQRLNLARDFAAIGRERAQDVIAVEQSARVDSREQAPHPGND
jgi:hypothetical protein